MPFERGRWSITPRRERALAALLTSPTKELAAKAAGIDSKTLRRYLSEPEFQERYRAAFGELVGDATRQAKQNLSPALACLREIVADEKQGAQARIQAARALLEYGLRLVEVEDILRQLDELEAWRDLHEKEC